MAAIIRLVVGASIIALASCSAATDGLLLVQTRAELKARRPTEHVSTGGVEDDFAAVDAQVAKLEASVVEVQRQHREAVSDATKEYQGKLTAQLAANRLLAETNSKLVDEIDRLDGSNAHLRKQAAALQKELRAVETDQRALAKNFTSVQEFTADAIKNAGAETKASELDVLDELEKEDSKQHALSEKKRHLEDIAAQGTKANVALLQKPAQNGDAEQDKDPKNLLTVLDSQLTGLEREQAASLTKLQEKFAEKIEALDGSHTKLLAEQTKLEATKASLTELQERLMTAVQYLDHKRKESLEHSRSVRRFAASVGKRPLPDAEASLLQLDAVPLQSEPEESAGLSDPSRPTVVHTLSSQIRALEKRVQSVQKENDEAVAKRKTSYELKLKAQQAENHDVTSENAHLSTEIANLEVANSNLQEKAESVAKTNHRLRNEVLTLQENVSTIQAFSDQLLKDVVSSGAPQLEVLRELAAESEKRESRRVHENRLGEIAGKSQPQSSLSMLEFTANGRVSVPAGSDPTELATLLEGNLEALAAEQAGREAILEREFKEKSHAFSVYLAKLLAERKALKQRREALLTLNSRLEAAVAHLDSTEEQLHAGLDSLRVFMLRMSDGSSNASALASTGEPHSEQKADPRGKMDRGPAAWASRLATWAGVGSGQ